MVPGQDASEMPDEWQFYPDGWWRTPSFQGYMGTYSFPDHRTLRMTYPERDQTINFGFTLVGDELTMYLDQDTWWAYRRVPTPVPRTPTATSATPEAASTPSPSAESSESTESPP
jgi:hypothetical protein